MTARAGMVAATLSLAMALSPRASAQQPPPPPQQAPVPELVAPKLETQTDVPYPEGATGDAIIVLTLTVAKDGSVQAADVTTGADPFASAARAAVLKFHFAPATRAGTPVNARIRFEITFHAPVVVEAPPPPAPVTPPAPTGKPGAPNAPPPPAAPPRPIDILVQGDKPPPSVTTMSRAEVRQLPGAFGDPFRALEIMPGVTPIVSGVPYFYVRGAPPGNVGYFLDGVRVPYLFHVGAGPSIVNPAMVEKVDLYSGGYPARFGRFAGAIVDAETTEPRRDLHGEGNIRIFDAGAMVEGPLFDGKATVLLGGRYSYTGALFSLLSPTVKLDYRDYQARFTYDLTPHDRIGLFAFGAYDLLSQVENNIESIIFGSEFYRFDGRYDHDLGKGGKLRLAATWGFDQTRVGEQRNARDMLGGARLEITQPISENVTVRGGADGQVDDYRADARKWADPDDPDSKAYDALFPQRTDTALGAWVDVVWKVAPRLELTPGVRFDLFKSGSATGIGVDPRLAVRVDVNKHVRLLHALGIAHQPPSFLVPVPGLAVGNLQGGLQTSVQAAAGVELELPEEITATVTVFDDIFLNMSDTLSVNGTRDATTSEPRTQGYGRGLEVYVRRKLTRRLGGFVSYTFSRSQRSFNNAYFPSAFDRTHVLNAAAAYDLGRGWRAGARFTFYTGSPVLGFQNAVNIAARQDPARDPAFYRIDWRVEKRWQLDHAKWVSFVAEMLNTTLHKETLNGREIGPVSIPSLGVEGGL